MGCQAVRDSTCRDVGPLACSMTLPPGAGAGAGADQVDSVKMVGMRAEKWGEGTGCTVQCSERHKLYKGEGTGDLERAWERGVRGKAG